MTFAKGQGIKLLALVFTFSIFGMAVATATNSVFSTPDRLKQSLQEGKVYDAVAASIVDKAVEDADAKSDIPLDNPLVQQAAKAAVTPALIQENGEKVIDGTYAWLQGKTKTPDFRINTQEIQNEVAANVSQAGEQRVRKLPACTFAQLQQIDPSTVNPFTLPCQPQGYDISAFAEQYQREIAASDEFFEQKDITAQDVKTTEGQNVFAQAEQMPRAYQLGQKLPWVFGILAILSAVGIVLLHETRLKGLMSLALALLAAGVILFISSLATSYVLNTLKPTIGGPESAAIQDAALSVVKTLTNELNRTLIIFATVYTVVGTGGLVGLRFAKAKAPAIEPPNQEKEPEPKTDSDKTPKIDL